MYEYKLADVRDKLELRPERKVITVQVSSSHCSSANDSKSLSVSFTPMSVTVSLRVYHFPDVRYKVAQIAESLMEMHDLHAMEKTAEVETMRVTSSSDWSV